MELTKKTTILFSEDLHRRLTCLAEQRETSLGELVREACIRQYGLASPEDRLEAVGRLASLTLPVSDPGRMKRESVPDPDEIAR